MPNNSCAHNKSPSKRISSVVRFFDAKVCALLALLDTCCPLYRLLLTASTTGGCFKSQYADPPVPYRPCLEGSYTVYWHCNETPVTTRRKTSSCLGTDRSEQSLPESRRCVLSASAHTSKRNTRVPIGPDHAIFPANQKGLLRRQGPAVPRSTADTVGLLYTNPVQLFAGNNPR